MFLQEILMNLRLKSLFFPWKSQSFFLNKCRKFISPTSPSLLRETKTPSLKAVRCLSGSFWDFIQRHLLRWSDFRGSLLNEKIHNCYTVITNGLVGPTLGHHQFNFRTHQSNDGHCITVYITCYNIFSPP